MNWTDERVELLQKLWAEGLSASQIAAQLGGVSRNAVIGKVHRLKLSSRGRATVSPVKSAKPAPKAPGAKPAQRNVQPLRPAPSPGAAHPVGALAPAVRIMPPAEPLAAPTPRRLALTELSDRTCKWPLGDPLAEDFSFCGNECAETGPYCKFHARMAFQPASERRRLR